MRRWWWHCAKCGARMTPRLSLTDAEWDRDQHRAYAHPDAVWQGWQLMISSALIEED